MSENEIDREQVPLDKQAQDEPKLHPKTAEQIQTLRQAGLEMVDQMRKDFNTIFGGLK